jgi:CxxC motif-containing protein
LAKAVLHTVRPEGSASLLTESRPMSPAISLVFKDQTPSVPLPHQRAQKPRIKVKSQKAIAKPLAKEMRHTIRPESSASPVTESRPMSPAISMAFKDPTASVLLPHQRAQKPRIKVKSQKAIPKPLAKEIRHSAHRKPPHVSREIDTFRRPNCERCTCPPAGSEAEPFAYACPGAETGYQI